MATGCTLFAPRHRAAAMQQQIRIALFLLVSKQQAPAIQAFRHGITFTVASHNRQLISAVTLSMASVLAAINWRGSELTASPPPLLDAIIMSTTCWQSTPCE